MMLKCVQDEDLTLMMTFTKTFNRLSVQNVTQMPYIEGTNSLLSFRVCTTFLDSFKHLLRIFWLIYQSIIIDGRTLLDFVAINHSQMVHKKQYGFMVSLTEPSQGKSAGKFAGI